MFVVLMNRLDKHVRKNSSGKVSTNNVRIHLPPTKVTYFGGICCSTTSTPLEDNLKIDLGG